MKCKIDVVCAEVRNLSIKTKCKNDAPVKAGIFVVFLFYHTFAGLSTNLCKFLEIFEANFVHPCRGFACRPREFVADFL